MDHELSTLFADEWTATVALASVCDLAVRRLTVRAYHRVRIDHHVVAETRAQRLDLLLALHVVDHRHLDLLVLVWGHARDVLPRVVSLRAPVAGDPADRAVGHTRA